MYLRAGAHVKSAVMCELNNCVVCVDPRMTRFCCEPDAEPQMEDDIWELGTLDPPEKTVHTATNAASWLHHCSHHSLPHGPALSLLTDTHMHARTLTCTYVF